MASPRDDLEHPLFSADRPEPLLEWHRALRFSHPPNMGIGLGGSRMTTKGSRTAQEVFQDHARAIAAGDLDGIVGDYSEDAMFITHAGVLHGKDGVREGPRGCSGISLIPSSTSTRGSWRATCCSSSGRLRRGARGGEQAWRHSSSARGKSCCKRCTTSWHRSPVRRTSDLTGAIRSGTRDARARSKNRQEVDGGQHRRNR
jgi:hypothetical protein